MILGRIFCSQIKVMEWRNQYDFDLRNNLDVWRIYIPDFIDKINDEIHILNDEEIDKSAAFVQEADKLRFLIGKIYLKKLLANYLNIHPKEVGFSFNEHKKPFLTKLPSLNFNVSHSGDFVVIGFSNRWLVGVDVEVMNTNVDLYSMIYSTMSSVEVHTILNSESPREMFYNHWTRKEALLKCVGIGLTDSLQDFSVCDGLNLVPSDLASFVSTWNIRNFVMNDKYSVSVAYDASIRVIRFYELSND